MSQPTTGIYFNSTVPPAPDGNQNTVPQSDGGVPQQKVSQYPQKATDALLGVVKPDGTTIVVAPDGTLSTETAGAPDLITAIQQEWYVFGLDTGTANAYVVAQTPGPNIVAGSKVVFLALNANNGPSTLTIDSSPQSTSPITKEGAFPLTGGEIDQGQIIELVFDGINFQIVGGGSGSISTGGSGGGGGSGAGSGLGDVIPSGAIDGVNTIFTIPSDGSPGPGGGAGTSSLRGSAIQTSTGSSSITISLPAGCVAGDLAILFANSGWSVTVPSGWTTLYLNNGLNWNILAASKVLSSGDISAGSVTVTASSSFDMAAGLAVFVGSAGGVRETEAAVSSGGLTLTNVTTGSVLSTDTAIYWATNREDVIGGGAPTLPVITPATGAAAQLFNAASTNAWSLLAYQAMPGGSLSVGTFFPNPGGGGGEQAIQVIVADSGASGGGGTSGGARGNLYLNGSLQDPLKADPDYTLVGTTITMRNPPVAVPAPDSLLWVYLSGSVGPPGPAGGGITTLVGDVTASGVGTVNATLAASGVTAGTYEKVTVDGKGRVTVGGGLSGSDIIAALGVQAENTVLAGPIGPTSPAALPTFRALVAADLVLPAPVTEVPTGTMNGTNVTFTLSNTPNPAASLSVYLNGVWQDTDWISVSGATVTFTVAPKSTDKMRAKYTH